MSGFLTKTIDLRTLLDIASLLVALWSLIKVRTAKQAVRVERQKRLRQRALEDFNRIAFCATTLENRARLKDLERLAELSLELKGQLATARGEWARLITTEESANLEAAIMQIDQLRGAIPQRIEELEIAAIHRMSAVCDYVLVAANPIAGRLRFSDQMEEQEWQQTQRESRLARVTRKLLP